LSHSKAKQAALVSYMETWWQSPKWFKFNRPARGCQISFRPVWRAFLSYLCQYGNAVLFHHSADTEHRNHCCPFLGYCRSKRDFQGYALL